MATLNKLLVDSQKAAAANTPEVFYTSPSNGLGTTIINFTGVNDTANTFSEKVYIVPSGGTPITPVVPTRNIVSNRADVSPEMAGQLIPPGGTLQMESSSAATISWTVSGREHS